MANFSKTPNYDGGYPTPGPQNPTIDHILNHNFFASEEEWKFIREEKQYDYVVVGTGFCGYAFINEILKNDENAKILLLERGGFHLPEHFQNLPLPYQKFLGGISETFPWSLDRATHLKDNSKGDFITWQHGMLPFFGGRSTTWSAWCPVPNSQETKHWNKDLIKRLSGSECMDNYIHGKNVTPIDKALELLNVISADTLASNPETNKSYNSLHTSVSKYFEGNITKTINFHRAFAAPLSANGHKQGEDFHKFSTPENILKLKLEYQENLDIVTNVVVERIINEEVNDKLFAYALETSRGIINLNNAKLIIATGTLPATTLIQNSFPSLDKVGSRFSSHMISSIVARIKKSDFKPLKHKAGVKLTNDKSESSNKLSFSAMYVGGIEDGQRKDGAGEFHIQMTFIEQEKMSDKSKFDKIDNELIALKHMPDVVATASKEQLKDGEEYITIVCAILGEIGVHSEGAEKNKFVKNSNDNDITTNSILSVHANPKDLKTWEAMDLFACDILTNLAGGDMSKVNYWVADGYGPKGAYKNFKIESETNNMYPSHLKNLYNSSAKDNIKFREYLTGKYDGNFNMVRVPGMVHESSTMWIDKNDKDGVVDANYQPIGTENVYITGGSLWPTGGSWNPTLMMTAMAIDLANCIQKK